MRRPADPDELAEWWEAEGRLKVRCPFCFHFARFCGCRRVRVEDVIDTTVHTPRPALGRSVIEAHVVE